MTARLIVSLAAAFLAVLAILLGRVSRYPGDSLSLWIAGVLLILSFAFWTAAQRSTVAARVSLVNLAALAASLVMGDVYFAYREWQLETAQFEYASKNREPRSILRIVADSRQRGIPAVPLLYPQALTSQSFIRARLGLDEGQILPLGGIGNRPTILCTEPGEVVEYVSDRHGFNNPANAWDQLSRFIILGDSFTQGFCVPNGRSYADLIRSNGGGAINLGMAGNGPIAALAGLREYGPLLTGTDILWFFYEGNDFGDVLRESMTRELAAYLDPAYRRNLPEVESMLFEKLGMIVDERLQGSIDTPAPTFNMELANVVLLRHLRQAFGLAFGDEYGFMNRTLVRAANALSQEAARTYRELHVVYLPSFAQLALPNARRTSYKQTLRDVIQDAGINWIDVTPQFKQVDNVDDLFAIKAGPYRGHYSELGHRLVAEKVLSALSAGPAKKAPE